MARFAVAALLVLAAVPCFADYWCNFLDDDDCHFKCQHYFNACAEHCVVNNNVCPPSLPNFPSLACNSAYSNCWTALQYCWDRCVDPDQISTTTTTTPSTGDCLEMCPTAGTGCPTLLSMKNPSCCDAGETCQGFHCPGVAEQWQCFSPCP